MTRITLDMEWVCPSCGKSYNKSIVKLLESFGVLEWSKPISFYRDLEKYEYPLCVACNGVLKPIT